MLATRSEGLAGKQAKVLEVNFVLYLYKTMRLGLLMRIHTADLCVSQVEYLEVCVQLRVVVVARGQYDVLPKLHIRTSRVSIIIHTTARTPCAHLLIIVFVFVVSFEVIVVNILVEVGHDREDTHVDEHEDSKHEELGSLQENLLLNCEKRESVGMD